MKNTRYDRGRILDMTEEEYQIWQRKNTRGKIMLWERKNTRRILDITEENIQRKNNKVDRGRSLDMTEEEY